MTTILSTQFLQNLAEHGQYISSVYMIGCYRLCLAPGDFSWSPITQC